jgi:hypothetical protein
MRVVCVVARLVDGGEPCGAVLGDASGKASHQRLPLPCVQLARQGEHELVDDAGVLAVGPLLPIQPCPRRVRGLGHALGHEDGLGTFAGDVADMRPCGAGRMCRPADAAHVQAVDRNRPLRLLPVRR